MMLLQAAISAAGKDGGHFQQFELRLTSGVLFVHFNRVKVPKSELMHEPLIPHVKAEIPSFSMEVHDNFPLHSVS